MSDWDIDTTPVANRVEVLATLRNDEPVAVVKMTDLTGDTREVQFTMRSALDALEGLVKFVRTVGYADLRACPRCGMPAVVIERKIGEPTLYVHQNGRRCVGLEADLPARLNRDDDYSGDGL